MTSRRYRWIAIAAAVILLVIALRTCGMGSELANPDPGEEVDAELTLQTVTLEQPDENGNLLWKLKAKAVNYTPDTQRAELSELEGQFFQDGETIYTVKADKGEVQQNGETLYLLGNLVASSIEDDLTLEGERLKWQPKQDLLVMGNFQDEVLDENLEDASAEAENVAAAESAQGETLYVPQGDELGTPDLLNDEAVKQAPVRGFHPRMNAIAQVARVSNKDNRVELLGGVAAKSKESPWLTFASKQLTWLTEQELIQTEEPLTVEQYEADTYAAVTDRIVGAKGNVQLAENIVTLTESVQLESFSNPLKVNSDVAVWDVDGETVVVDSPVNIEQPERRITASANQARLDLAQQIIYLAGDVRANGAENDSRLQANSVVWNTQSQDVEAEGNVQYTQAASPEASIAGERAVGNIEQGTVVVLGGQSGEVVTEIVPEDFN